MFLRQSHGACTTLTKVQVCCNHRWFPSADQLRRGSVLGIACPRSHPPLECARKHNRWTMIWESEERDSVPQPHLFRRTPKEKESFPGDRAVLLHPVSFLLRRCWTQNNTGGLNRETKGRALAPSQLRSPCATPALLHPQSLARPQGKRPQQAPGSKEKHARGRSPRLGVATPQAI